MKRLSFLLLTFVLCFLTATGFAQSGLDLPAFSQKIDTVGQTPQNGTNAVQTLTIGGTPTGGTFTLTYAGMTSGAITWSATNATLIANIQAALDAMPTVGSGSTVVSAGTVTAGIGTVLITFSGANLSKLLVPAIGVGANSMTGTAPTAAVAITTAGVTADGRNAPKGRLLIDISVGKLYINTGTPSAPTWTVVGTQT